jgi:hypothetical protein
VAAEIERQVRAAEAQAVMVAAEIAQRSRKELGTDSLASKRGCRNAIDLIERVTLISGSNAARRIKVGTETRRQVSILGEPFPATFPAVARALESGALGVDSAHAIIATLLPTLRLSSVENIQRGEVELVAAATGPTQESSVAAAADEIRRQAEIWATVLDPDGLEPVEERAMRNRGFSRGVLRDGLMHGKYALMPETHATLERIFDAYTAADAVPKFMTDEQREAEKLEKDPRTDLQKRHDILHTIVDTMARSGQTPTIGGAAPTVLVSVRADDLRHNQGAGHIDGASTPISMRVVKQYACTGGTQPVVIDEHGAIISLGSPQRTFTPQQRKAITLRDGGCVIPGCKIPAGWCEIHHVIPYQDGGPTHTSNGVLLCWFHHRTIDTSGWLIKMIRGAPYLKPPPWLEWDSPWRPTSKSPTTLTDKAQRLPY